VDLLVAHYPHRRSHRTDQRAVLGTASTRCASSNDKLGRWRTGKCCMSDAQSSRLRPGLGVDLPKPGCCETINSLFLRVPDVPRGRITAAQNDNEHAGSGTHRSAHMRCARCPIIRTVPDRGECPGTPGTCHRSTGSCRLERQIGGGFSRRAQARGRRRPSDSPVARN
jgi:hypothetical protein